MRYCDFTNMETGQRIRCQSVVRFCQVSGLQALDKNAIIHIYALLNGHRFSHLNWCLTKNYNLRVKIKDHYGNIYNEKVRDYPIKYDIAIQTIWRLFTKRVQSTKGLYLYDNKINYVPLNPLKPILYVLTTKNNKELKATNIRKLINQIGQKNLHYRTMLHLIHGSRDHVKKYKIKTIKYKHRTALK